MPLLIRSSTINAIELLNAYRNQTHNQGNWPFNANGDYIWPNLELNEILNEYFDNYIEQFNAFQVNVPVANPLESHPYIPIYQIESDKKLLIIGTFPPFSYFTQHVNLNGIQRISNIYNRQPLNNISPQALFFYGNRGSFWNYAPEFIGPITEDNCQIWLNNNNATISDIIFHCQRRHLNNPDDTNLFNIIPYYELIHTILSKNSNFEALVFTSGKLNLNFHINGRQAGLINVNGNNISAFSVFCRALQDLEIPFGFRPLREVAGDAATPVVPPNDLGSLEGKALFSIELGQGRDRKLLKVVCLPSPSGGASRQMRSHPFFNNWFMETYNQRIIHAYNSNMKFQGIFNHFNLQEPITTNFRREIYRLCFESNYNQLLYYQNNYI